MTTVWVIHLRFLREGWDVCLGGRPDRRDKRRSLLTGSQARQLLARYAVAAAKGEISDFDWR